jgi:hypothetical protein
MIKQMHKPILSQMKGASDESFVGKIEKLFEFAAKANPNDELSKANDHELEGPKGKKSRSESLGRWRSQVPELVNTRPMSKT